MSLILDLSPEKEAELEAAAKAAGLSVKDYAERALSRILTTEAQLQRQPDERPIWEVILDNMKDVPSEEFKKLPRDGAAQVDHYLYGHPKR